VTSQPRTLDRLEVAGRKVLCRVDFNVPLDGQRVTDDTRIRRALPTIEHLRSQASRVILCSHLGRPGGKPNGNYSLLPAAERLATLIDAEVVFCHDTVGDEVTRIIDESTPGAIIVLENLRFFAGEKSNDPAFAKGLADLADVYVNDAFGTMHRAHASIVGVPKLLEHTGVGRLVEREVHALSGLLSQPKRPFGAVLGGAKVSDKIEVIDRLSTKVDHLFIGGAMAYTFLAAQGKPIGASRVEEDAIEFAEKMLREATSRGCRFHLPVDHVVAQSFAEDAPSKVVETIEDGWMGLDVGPATAEGWSKLLLSCRTLLWNGPLGVFEWEAFANGTRTVAHTFANAEGYTVVGGGDSAAAASAFEVAHRIDHVSTGGGASLELLRTGELVGLTALERRR
jgi:phosphoglycerate kinase